MVRPLSLALPVLLAVAGCAPGPVSLGTPIVDEARLSQDTLTLVLTDGTRCMVNWRVAPVGRIDGCGPGYGYAVKEIENPNILRRIWTEVTTALGADGIVPPLAEVVVTDPAGVDKVFVSPPPVED